MAEIHKRFSRIFGEVTGEVVQEFVERAERLAKKGREAEAHRKYAEALNLGIYAEEFPFPEAIRQWQWGGLFTESDAALMQLLEEIEGEGG